MSVSKFILPSNAVDGDLSVLARIAAIFAPHSSDPLSLAVVVDPGHLMVGGTLIETDAQLVDDFTPPVTDPRIDRIVISLASGVASVLPGAEDPTPVPPALEAGFAPVAQVRLTPDVTAITNDRITDERDFSGLAQAQATAMTVQRFTASGTYTPTPGTTGVIVELIGGGASGGGCAAPGGSQGAVGAGGSAGSFARARFTSGFAGVAVTVGSGGAAPASGANPGNPGAASGFGTLVSAPGGIAGLSAPAYTAPAIVGGSPGNALPTGANLIAASGGAGTSGFVLSQYVVLGGNGGNSYYGGSGAGGGNGPGLAGLAPGAGGGGASSIGGAPARPGGAGGAGLVTIYEFG
ncbi:hypothetical protein Q9Q95_03595 [Sphingomonas sp. DG1-23]|uniref:glycine-rich domain-containing protein n=1 Tax=Sphingomonas sp. DG1-23 TaxID=3068316 RepID=UPI00273FE700|nr:hypothetical protein [Sphingomonas sp. DG1-23]MDP5277996.1 hypothetical protein [Sphingomonas sp. DG1-23]